MFKNQSPGGRRGEFGPHHTHTSQKLIEAGPISKILVAGLIYSARVIDLRIEELLYSRYQVDDVHPKA